MNDYNYYSILGLDTDASEIDIKKAFHRLALKYHPDKNPENPEAEQKFKEISSAYDVLGNPSKRSAYDISRTGRWAESDFTGNYRNSAFGGCGGRGCCGMRGGGRRKAFRHTCVVELSQDEARSGTEKRFIVQTPFGIKTLSVDIPAGTVDGAVYMVGGYNDDAIQEGFTISIKIV